MSISGKFAILLLTIIAYLPTKVLYVISDTLYLIMRYVVGYRVDVVKNNLRNSFPEKGRDELCRIEKRFYHHLCDCIMETIKLLHVSDDEMDKRVSVNGADYVESIATGGRSVIVFMSHYGNWEWAQEITRYYSCPPHSAALYRKIKSRWMNEVMKKIRSRYNTELILQKEGARKLLSYRKQGHQTAVGFIADQRPNSSNLNHWTIFLGQETAYPVGGEEIGKHIEAGFVYLDVEKPKRGHYVLTFRSLEPSSDEEYPYMKAYLRYLEATIRREPAYWLWSHKRWRIKPKNVIRTDVLGG